MYVVIILFPSIIKDFIILKTESRLQKHSIQCETGGERLGKGECSQGFFLGGVVRTDLLFCDILSCIFQMNYNEFLFL